MHLHMLPSSFLNKYLKISHFEMRLKYIYMCTNISDRYNINHLPFTANCGSGWDQGLANLHNIQFDLNV